MSWDATLPEGFGLGRTLNPTPAVDRDASHCPRAAPPSHAESRDLTGPSLTWKPGKTFPPRKKFPSSIPTLSAIPCGVFPLGDTFP